MEGGDVCGDELVTEFGKRLNLLGFRLWRDIFMLFFGHIPGRKKDALKAS